MLIDIGGIGESFQSDLLCSARLCSALSLYSVLLFRSINQCRYYYYFHLVPLSLISFSSTLHTDGFRWKQKPHKIVCLCVRVLEHKMSKWMPVHERAQAFARMYEPVNRKMEIRLKIGKIFPSSSQSSRSIIVMKFRNFKVNFEVPVFSVRQWLKRDWILWFCFFLSWIIIKVDKGLAKSIWLWINSVHWVLARAQTHPSDTCVSIAVHAKIHEFGNEKHTDFAFLLDH